MGETDGRNVVRKKKKELNSFIIFINKTSLRAESVSRFDEFLFLDTSLYVGKDTLQAERAHRVENPVLRDGGDPERRKYSSDFWVRPRGGVDDHESGLAFSDR